MSKFWEKFFYLMTVVVQGSSFLSPRAYAILHRLHHAHSDTEKDPHSPHFAKSFGAMMYKTAIEYDGYLKQTIETPSEAKGHAPTWPAIDRLADSWTFRIGVGTLYTLFILYFMPAGQYYWLLLAPIHWLMGPIHGAIVNWCGHMYGYRNHKNLDDKSTNFLVWDLLIGGELYQNNHHAHPNSPNFAYRWFEIDSTYWVMRLLHSAGIIEIQYPAWTEKGKKEFKVKTLAHQA